MLAEGLVAALELVRLPADLAQDDLHGAAAHAAAPAIDQRPPVLGHIQHALLDMRGNIGGNQRTANLLGLKRRNLLVDGADLGALLVAQYRAVDRAWHMVFGKFERGAHIDDGAEVANLGGGNKPGIFHVSSRVGATRYLKSYHP